MTHGTFCKTWDRDRTILKSKQRDEVKEARRNELFARLEALALILEIFEIGKLSVVASSAHRPHLPSNVGKQFFLNWKP